MTKIEWATEVWNPITGCTPISEGCANCYARRMAQRLKGRFGYPEDEPFRVTFHPDRLYQPLKWRKPRHIFVCSMGDLFHGGVRLDWQGAIWKTIRKATWHTFLILTKRENNMQFFFETCMKPPPNVWLGITAENQQTADKRIPILLQIPAAKRFVSIEPMLGPVNLCEDLSYPPFLGIGLIDWVIAGCESGSGRRPAKIEWFRDLKNRCVQAGVPFFLKQMATEPPTMAGCETGLPMYYENFKSKVIKMPELDGKIWNERP